MKPIYKPKGAAKEYGDYALNIYTGYRIAFAWLFWRVSIGFCKCGGGI